MEKTILILLAGILLVSGCINASTTGDVVSTQDANRVMKIPVSEISSQVKFYSFNSGGTKVNFFAVKGSDGKIRTAFDACDVCGGYKGYRQEGNDMVCNNCGRYFDINDIGTKNRGGGCWPSYLSHRTEGDNIVIEKSELLAGKWRFE